VAAVPLIRLRALRQQSCLTQTELAARAGVSRQLVAAVEAGHNVPAVDAALRLARALGVTVEDLFAAAPPTVVPAVSEQIIDGVPLRIGRVGDQLVATEMAERGAVGGAWASADGVASDGVTQLLPGAAPAGLVVAGCDPALGVAEDLLGRLGSRGLMVVAAPTGMAVAALAAGRVHAAVVHGPAGALPPAPLPVARLHFAHWQVGVAVPPSLGRRTLDDLLGGTVPIVQREPTAASQQALDRASARAGAVVPAGPTVTGHIEAARTAAIVGCAALTTESAAAAFGLRFHSLEHHTVQIWVAEQWLSHPSVSVLGDLLVSRAFRDRVSLFGGYDLIDCGRRIDERTAV
jgi:DNA-binding XRE family transcriptional regulator